MAPVLSAASGNLDEKQIEDDMFAGLTPMLKQYQQQKLAHPDCLLFFRLGDFYELFFEDAVTAAKVLQITLTQRGKVGDMPIPMCGIPFHAYENYIKKLIDAGFRVAICEQTETLEMRQRNGGKGPLSREVVRIITPATVIEENLLSARNHNFLLAVAYDPKLKKQSFSDFSCALLDLSSSDFFIEEVSEDQLFSVIEKYHPSEILLPDTLYGEHFERLRFYGNRIISLPIAKFDCENALVRLKSFYDVKTLEGIADFKASDILAANVILDYLEITQKQATPLIPFPKKRNTQQYLLLDQHTRRNLELEFTARGMWEGSFLHAIDKTLTSAGSRLLGQMVASPLLNKDAIEERLDAIAFCLDHHDVLQACRTAFQVNADLGRSTTRICLQKGGPRDLFVIGAALKTASYIKDVIESTSSPKPFVVPEMLDDLEQELTNALSESLPLLTRDGGFIRLGYDDELDAIRAFEKDAASHLEALQEKLKNETGITTLKVKYNGILGYFLEFPASQCDKVPASFIPRQSLATSLRYTTPELNEFASKILSAGEKALQRELFLFDKLVKKVTAHQTHLLHIAQFLAFIDVSTSMATLAVEKNYCRPILNTTSDLFIENGRHPVLDGEGFEPNSVIFNNQTRFILLTGPNMAGKSTYLRQIALIALMAQCGFYVPATKAVIGIVDRIFSRIGAGDDLASGRSTFMVEMIETAAILNQATPQSLVILDELGRGTSTYDGLSLAWAVTESLVNSTKARCIFATHYFELTDLEKQLPSFKNYRLATKEYEGKILFLHRVEEGSANSSYGLHVAALSGVPRPVIERAQEILLDLSKNQHHIKSERRAQLSLNLTQTTPLAKRPESSHVADTIYEALQKADLNSLTPIAALNFLHTLKEKM